MKRLLISLLIVSVLLSLLPLQAMAAPKEPTEAEKAQTIEVLQALLSGLQPDPDGLEKIAYWDDGLILDSIYRKLLGQMENSESDPYLNEMDIGGDVAKDGEISYDLERVLQLSLQIFGRGFSKETGLDYIRVDEDKLWISLSDKKNPKLYLFDWQQTDELLLATGMTVTQGEEGQELGGYFLAQFRVNDTSTYGYTLISLAKLSGKYEISDLTAEASGCLNDNEKYAAANVLDGNKKTAWIEGAKGVGVDEWIRLQAPEEETVSFVGVEMKLGYHKNESSLEKNGRPTKMRIETDTGFKQEVELEADTELIIFDKPVTASRVRFTIVDAKAGKEFEDTCISEIRLCGVDSKRAFEGYWEKHSVGSANSDEIETLYCGDVSITRQPGFEKGTVLDAPPLTGDAERKALSSFAEGELESHVVYDLIIRQGEEIYQEEKRILEIRIPVPDPAISEGWMVYRIKDNTHTRVQYEYEDGCVVLRTRDLGCYIVTRLNSGSQAIAAEDGGEQEEGVNWTLIFVLAGLAVLVVIAGAVTIAILRKKWEAEDAA